MEPKVISIYHASLILDWVKIIYVDPAWNIDLYKDKPSPDLVLITDIHYDHLNVDVLENLKGEFLIITPKAVYDELTDDLKQKTKILNNGEEIDFEDFKILSLPMYNLTSERLEFHPKGRGNGYLIEKENFKVYIAGDTEDIVEMRNLKNIDIAFCQ
jgi:L-ascorbate metabolism protein UlaG (beta-lactamase superfamily)